VRRYSVLTVVVVRHVDGSLVLVIVVLVGPNFIDRSFLDLTFNWLRVALDSSEVD
jgi:hypothetical protein